MRNFNKLRKLLLGGTTPYYLPYYSGALYQWITPLYLLLNSNFTPLNIMNVNLNLPYFNSFNNISKITNNSYMLGGILPLSITTPNVNSENTNKELNEQLVESAVKTIGSAASIGTRHLNKDMYYGENLLKAEKIASNFEQLPIFGSAFLLGRFGFSAFTKGISKDMNEFDYDSGLQERLGGSYNFENFNKAKELSNKKAFGKAFKTGQNIINDSLLQKLVLNSIDSDLQARLAMADDILMNAMNYINRLNGNVDFNNMRIGRLGFKLENLDRCHKIKITHVVNVDTKRIEEFKPVIPEFKEGGNIEKEWKPLFIYLKETDLKKQKDDKYKDVYDFYKDYDLSKINIIEGNEAKTEGNNIYITNEEDLVHELCHYISQNKPNEIYKEFYDNLNDLRIQELGGDLLFINRLGDPGVFYHPSELEARIKAAKYKTRGLVYTKLFFNELRLNPEKYGYNMRDLLHMYNDENLEKIFNLKKGGSIKESDELVKLEETNLKNVIPDGALHKNKHHMEHTEGLTQKGIPVIDNDGELQAEVELNEIIFTLEVTKKLEELHKIYKEGSKSDLDKAAIEAGKLLVLEILYNTIDRTGLISKCENGGKL